MGTAYVHFQNYDATVPVRFRLSLTQFDNGTAVTHYITVDIRSPMSAADIADLVKLDANLQDAIKNKIVHSVGSATLQINNIEALDIGSTAGLRGRGGTKEFKYAAYPAPVPQTAPDGPVGIVLVPAETLGDPQAHTYPDPNREIEKECKRQAEERKLKREQQEDTDRPK